MATYYVWSGAGGTNNGTSWTNAYTAFGSAVTAATTNGDEILVHYTHQEELAADTTYTFGANVNVYSVDKDSSDALTAMGTGGWIGNSTTNRGITVTGSDRRVYFNGITLRLAGSTADSVSPCNGAGMQAEYENCYLWQGNTSSLAMINTCRTEAYAKYTNCTFRFAHASQRLALGGHVDFVGGAISADGTALSTLFGRNGTELVMLATWIGGDLSHITGTLLGNTDVIIPVLLSRCKLGSGVIPLASQTNNPTKGSANITLLDCHSGDTHTFFGYYDALGQVTSDTGIYFTSGAAAQSWKIVTTANAGFGTPFVTPWIPLYNTGTSAITPYFEILRDGSTTAYQNDEVWAEFSAKTTSGFVTATAYNDRMTPRAAPADQAAGAGTGSWTGEAASAWSGKIDSGSSFTPAEVGDIGGRIVVGEPSITVYADPQIRT